MSFCSDDKAGHRFWILADTTGQKMMQEFLVPYYNYEPVPHTCNDGGREQMEQSSHLSVCGRCHESAGKRIRLDPPTGQTSGDYSFIGKMATLIFAFGFAK
ncbi:hypothetical protein PDJAM_G00222800 [Pangasius djambal]|uniref:Uncharacterized protein n=1 Tax=Pangasius djambal TaxID=1691987 RepID=A0ACC5YD84_9TELE|nr:hypothetical protein [Pangasius djambal]